MRFKIISAALLALICILPGSKAGFFNGLPLSAFEIILAFLFFWLIIATPWEKQKLLKRLVLSSLVFLLIFQILSYKFLPYGWSVCLYSDAGRNKLESKCEPTAENPAGETSYIYNKIDFTSENMPLYFMNNVSFNFYGENEGEPNRHSLPYVLEAQTYVNPQKNEKLAIQSEKKILININKVESVYAGKNKPIAFNLIPGKINHIFLKYDSARNKNNQLKAGLISDNFYKNSWPSGVFSVSLYKALNISIILILFFCFIYSLIYHFLEEEKKQRYILAVLGIALLAFFVLTTIMEVSFKIFFIPFLIILFSTSAYYLFSSSLARKKIIPFLLLIFFFNSAILTTSHLSPTETDLFSGGGDELGHESFSRSTFSVTSFDKLLYSTESKGIYYYQPLHRFFLAFFHKILGEPMWGPYFAQTFIFSLAFLFCIFTLHSLLGSASSISFGLSYFILLFRSKTSALTLFQTPYQQAIAFPLFILAIVQMLLLFKKSEVSWKSYFFLGLNWGAVFMIRTDWLPIIPGIVLFLALKFYKPKFKITSKTALSLFIIGLAILPLFIGFRNYSVAGTFAIMPISGFVNLLPEIKTALGQKINYYEHSTVKFTIEITRAFQGRYFELIGTLWKNIYKNIIATSIVRQFLWLFAITFSFLNIFYIIKKYAWKYSAALIILLASFVPLMFVTSFFGQHNGVAMYAIYDFFITIILAVNIQMIINQPIIFTYILKTYKKISVEACNFYEKIIK